MPPSSLSLSATCSMPVDLSHVCVRDRMRVDSAWSLRGVVKMMNLAVVSGERAELSHWAAEAVEAKCFSRFLCLPLVCAVSVLHILCLCWLKLSSQWTKKTHIGYKVLSHHVSVWSLISYKKRSVCFAAFRCARNVCVTRSTRTGQSPRSC